VKWLHTADWHVGRMIRGRSRADEHTAVLADIARVASGEAVDLVIVAGDLFDTATPTPEAERIVYRALLDLASTGATVLVLAGNHDSDRRLQAVEPLLDLGHVVTRPVFAKPDDGGVVEVVSRDGSETALVACLPFLSQRWVVKADELVAGGLGDAHQDYADRVRHLLAALTGRFAEGGTVNIVAAHCMVLGATTVGSERAAHSVFEYAVHATSFPASAHYVALGHLHRPQQVAGPGLIRYCGSPLMLDFGEVADAKSVSIVEAHAGTPAQVREVPLAGARRLTIAEGDLAALRLQVAGGALDDAWVKVRVHEPLRVGLADEVRALVPNSVDVEVVRPDAGPAPALDFDRTGRTPHELFSAYLSAEGIDDGRLGALFGELLDEVTAP
jgi:DNA repair protein SbcD/Mre11